MSSEFTEVHNESVESNSGARLNLDAELTIRQLVMYFGGDVTDRAITLWIHRRLLTPVGRDSRGRHLIRLRDAIKVEAQTHKQPRGRRRQAVSG